MGTPERSAGWRRADPILLRAVPLPVKAVEASPADVAQFAHAQNRHLDAFLDLTLDVPTGRGFPVSACGIRCSSMRCKHPFKIDFHGLLPDLTFQLGDAGFLPPS